MNESDGASSISKVSQRINSSVIEYNIIISMVKLTNYSFKFFISMLTIKGSFDFNDAAFVF
jgi:hypothetical protein